MISGNISTGKTKLVGFPLVKEMIKENESMFFLDPKEEYINQYYDELREKGYHIVLLNLRDLEKSEGWNPLEYPYHLYQAGKKDQALDYLEQIGQELFYDESTANPFWSQSATDIFTGIVLGLFQDAKEEEVNINSVSRLLDMADTKMLSSTYLTEYFKTKAPTNAAYLCASSTVFAPRETKGSILSIAKQGIKLLVSREQLSKCLNKTTFDMEMVSKKPTAIFFLF